MQLLYTFFTYIAINTLKVIAFFQPKIKLFVAGRKKSFSIIQSKINPKKPVFWIHAASLGEFEQGRPIIEEIKTKYPAHQIVVTFFSPSGLEVRKNYELANAVCYLPMDTPKNAKKWIARLQPNLAVFVKYEFWPNYLSELKKQQIPTLLVSGIFRENQIFFKPYGAFMRKALTAFSGFFVQDKTSLHLLENKGFNPVILAGDTRFDRVQKLLEANEKLPYIDNFVGTSSYITVAGSTWPEDEEQLVEYINHHAKDNEKFIIAPHNVKEEGIKKLKESLKKKTVLFSKKEGKDLNNFQVFIVDTYGILTKIYGYAHVAYIGGGYTKSGVHNTLEAATYGLPIVIGPNFKKFKEVIDLVELSGCTSVNNTKDLIALLTLLRDDEGLREEKSKITKDYVTQNLGATETIMKTIDQILTHEKV